MAVDVMTPTIAGVDVVLFLRLLICITVQLIMVKRRSKRKMRCQEAENVTREIKKKLPNRELINTLFFIRIERLT